MEKDMIITLDDDTSYALLDETTLQDKKYFFAVTSPNQYWWGLVCKVAQFARPYTSRL